MADVSVEFGAKDTGLEATLKTVQAEMSRLETEIKSGELSFNELTSAMRDLAKADKVSQQLQSIGGAAAGASPQVDKLGKDGKEMGDNVKKGSDKGGMSLGELAKASGVAGAAFAAGMAVFNTAMAGVQAVAASFGESLAKAADFQQLETSFNVLIGNTTLAKTFLKDLSEFAGSTPFTIPGLADASKTLLAFGVVSSEVIPIVSMLGDVAQGNEDKLKSLALAFGKVESQGRLTGEELNQMIDSGFNPLDSISQKTGKSMGELRKEMERGAITSSMIREAFTEATSEGGKFFEMTKKQGLTFNGVMSTMRDTLDDLYRRFGRPIIDALTPIIQGWSDRIAEIAPLFDIIGQAVANTITYFSDLIDRVFNVEKAVGNIGESIKAISGGEYAAGLENLFLSIQVWAAGSANEIYARFSAAFKTAGDFIMQQFSSGGPLVALFKNFAGVISGYITEKLYLVMSDFMVAIGKSGMAETFKYQADTAARSVQTSLNAIPLHAQLTAEKASESMGDIPKLFEKNMAAVPPLFNNINLLQGEIDANNIKIAASTKEITKSEQEAVAEAQAYFQQWQKSEGLKQQAINTALEEKAIKQDALNFELAIAEAKATGNEEEIEALTQKKEWLDNWQKAIASGMGEGEAAALANNLLAAKINADNIKVPAFTSAKQDAKEIETSLGNSKSFLEAMGKIKKVKAIEETKMSAKEARLEIEAFGDYMNVDLKGMAFPDIAKKLGVDKMGEAGSDQIRTIMNFVSESKDSLSVNPLDSDKFNAAWQDIRNTITGTKPIIDVKADTTDASTAINNAVGSVNSQVTTQTDDNNIQSTRATIERGLAGIPLTFTVDTEAIKKSIGEIDVSGGAGGGVLSSIESLVDTIAGYVETIKDRLPMTALA